MRIQLPRVGRPWRAGRLEDPRYALIRWQVLRAGLFPGDFDGTIVLDDMLHDQDPFCVKEIRPYLRFWLSKCQRRSVVRQFDQWLAAAREYCEAHPELGSFVKRQVTPGFPSTGETVQVMNGLLTDLGLPCLPYFLHEGISKTTTSVGLVQPVCASPTPPRRFE